MVAPLGGGGRSRPTHHIGSGQHRDRSCWELAVPVMARLFLGLGVALVVIGTALLALRSFGGFAAVATGLFLIAQGLIGCVAASPPHRLGMGLLLSAGFLALSAGVATPLLWIAQSPWSSARAQRTPRGTFRPWFDPGAIR